jgi:hypothetical protein
MEKRGGLVFQLATGTAVQLATAIDAALQDRVAWEFLLDSMPVGVDCTACYELINLLALNQAASFHRRIVLAATMRGPQYVLKHLLSSVSRLRSG